VIRLFAAIERFMARSGLSLGRGQTGQLPKLKVWLNTILFEAVLFKDWQSGATDNADPTFGRDPEEKLLQVTVGALPEVMSTLLMEHLFEETREISARVSLLHLESDLMQDLGSITDLKGAVFALLEVLHPSCRRHGGGPPPRQEGKHEVKRTKAVETLGAGLLEHAAYACLHPLVVPEASRQILKARSSLLEDVFLFLCHAHSMGALQQSRALRPDGPLIGPQAVLHHLLAYRKLNWLGGLSYRVKKKTNKREGKRKKDRLKGL